MSLSISVANAPVVEASTAVVAPKTNVSVDYNSAPPAAPEKPEDNTPDPVPCLPPSIQAILDAMRAKASKPNG